MQTGEDDGLMVITVVVNTVTGSLFTALVHPLASVAITEYVAEAVGVNATPFVIPPPQV